MNYKINQDVVRIKLEPSKTTSVEVQPTVVPLNTDTSLGLSLLHGVGITSLVAPLISESSSIVEHQGLWANTTREIVWPELFDDPFFTKLCNCAAKSTIGKQRIAAARPTIQRVIIDLVLAALAEQIQQMPVFVLSPRSNRALSAATGLNREVYRSAHTALLAAGITLQHPGKRPWGGHAKGFQTMVAFSGPYLDYAAGVALQVAAKAGPLTSKEGIPPREVGKVVIKLLNEEDRPTVLNEEDPLSKQLAELNEKLIELIQANEAKKASDLPNAPHKAEEGLYSGTMVVSETIGDTEQFWTPTKEQVLYNRIFHAESFDSPREEWVGGRIYAPFQNEPKERRPLILLAGEQTVELDYSGHHPRLLYHSEALEFKGDPYAISFHWPDACSTLTEKERRTIWKKVLNTALNAADTTEAMGSIRAWLLDQAYDCIKGRRHWLEDGKRYVTLGPPNSPDFGKEAAYRTATHLVPQLFRAIQNVHQKIGHKLFRSAWRQLQTLDATICLRVMKQLLGKEIPCLSLHDSFVVPASHGEYLREVMLEEYRMTMLQYTGRVFDSVIKKSIAPSR
jgi:hypothetical protein